MKVCVLAAGGGTRVSLYDAGLHKALLPVGNKAVISRVFDQFPTDAEFIVATGYLREQLRDFIALVHGDRNIRFVDVDNFDGPGSGPGYSLWSCRAYLDTPFYLTACDTLITSPTPDLDRNWIGVSTVDNPQLWCTAKTAPDGTVTRLAYKDPAGSHLAFVGLAGIADPHVFWDGMASSLTKTGEVQVNPGLEALIPHSLHVAPVDWLDTGTDETYRATLTHFERNFSFSGKRTDSTYLYGDRVVKFFPNKEASERRFERGLLHRNRFAKVDRCVGNFYSYEYAHGELLSKTLNEHAAHGFLMWLQTSFWRDVAVEPGQFADMCRRFYIDKTKQRLAAYLKRFSAHTTEVPLIINGTPCRSVAHSLAELTETFWTSLRPSTFHGDLHDDNVIVTPDGNYTLLDWREDFAGILEFGDRYYDLAKFLHTLLLPVDVMDARRFSLTTADGNVTIDHEISADRASALNGFWKFLSEFGYSRRSTEIINALALINMSPLYDQNLNRYLYHLGRYQLETVLAGGSLAPLAVAA